MEGKFIVRYNGSWQCDRPDVSNDIHNRLLMFATLRNTAACVCNVTCNQWCHAWCRDLASSLAMRASCTRVSSGTACDVAGASS
eukprot:scaffold192373_cov46-Prasinocladus_malaysianus.AAC.1